MKKILGILLILLITTSVFGQENIGDRSKIEYRHWSEWSNQAHFYTHIRYSNGDARYEYLYMLAYEPNFPRGKYEGTKRKVYLYCVQTTQEKTAIFREHYNWIRVSDAVFEGYYEDSGNSKDYDFHMYDKDYQNLSHSSVKVDGDYVTFTVDVTKWENNRIGCYQETVTLKLEKQTFDGNFYKVLK